MLNLNIGHKYWHIIEGHKTYPVQLGWNEAYDKLQPVSWTYDRLKELGYEGEQLVELLVKKYLGWRMFRVGVLATREYCLGLIGARGSGKSCCAAMSGLIDFMLRGVTVYSNMPIEARVFYKDAEKIYRSEPIDPEKIFQLAELYEDACLILDEPNVEYGLDAYRSTATVPLAFDYALQQMRKTKLHVIYAVQSDQFVTKRMRFQTDVYCQCFEASVGSAAKTLPRGHKVKVHSHDYSGLITGYPYYSGKEPMSRKIVTIRPWWSLYDTSKVQTRETNYKQYALSPTQLEALAKRDNTVAVAKYIYDSCIQTRTKDIKDEELWEIFGIEDFSRRVAIGMILAKMNVTKTEHRDGYYYHFPVDQ